MAEESNKAVKKGKNFFGRTISLFVNCLIMAGVVYAGYLLYKNPEAIKNYLDNQQKEEEKAPAYVDALFDKITDLSGELAQVNDMIVNQSSRFVEEDEILSLSEKYDNLEKNNLNIITSKADVAIVLGMVERMDRLESKVSKIAKVSDKGALVLSAAMLVKERADRGDKFDFEAEILSGLADNEPKIKDAVAAIVKASYEGVPSNQEIIFEFEKVYNKTAAISEIEGLSWKERIKAKFNEMVQIKRLTAKEIEEKDAKDNLDLIRDNVKAMRFAAALQQVDDVSLQGSERWKKLTERKVAFDRAVSKISAYSLAVMKVNTLRGAE